MHKRTRYHLRYLVSLLLIVTTLFVVVTGWIADLWDLNNFVLHTIPGYVMAALALIHTILEFPRLTAYIRGRMRIQQRGSQTEAAGAKSRKSAEARESRRMQTLISRRGVLGLILGGAGGFWAGRLLTREGGSGSKPDLGLQYHEWSKPDAASLAEGLVDWGERPDTYKTYPNAVNLSLPDPDLDESLPILLAIESRRSIRDYPGHSMTKNELSTLLYSTDGINLERGGLQLRASPSAGALYPIETYVLAHDVAGVEPGLYHYAPRAHTLERLRSADLRQESVRLGLMQGFLGEADVVIVLTAIFQRLRWRYRRRSYRYALLEAGHIGQNIYLASTELGFGACAVGAFLDTGLNTLLGVDGRDEAALYMIPVGRM